MIVVINNSKLESLKRLLYKFKNIHVFVINYSNSFLFYHLLHFPCKMSLRLAIGLYELKYVLFYFLCVPRLFLESNHVSKNDFYINQGDI